MNEERNKIKNEILEAIKKGNIKMVPKWHFILKAILLILGIILAFLSLLYITSFIFFTVKRSGAGFAPEFGSRGMILFLRGMPWLLIFLSLVCVWILEVLVRKYSFTYRNPLIYSLLGIMAIALVAGASFAPIHQPPVMNGHMGQGGGFRMLEHHQPDDIHRGTIILVMEDGFIIDKFYDGTSTVLISEDTILPFGHVFATGSDVVVLGDEEDHVIHAFGVRPIR